MLLNNKYTIRIFNYLLMMVISYFLISCRADPYKLLYGRWEIYKYTTLYTKIGIADLDENSINKCLIGKEVVITKSSVLMNGVKYRRPIYKIREENPSEYFFWFWRINKQDVQSIGIQEEVDKIKIFNISIDSNEKKEALAIDWQENGTEKYLTLDEIVYHNGELGIFHDVYFFHLKKIK